ncbi:hypothetical protein THARTR1_01561 [Trichoderma harzianum]|uniref:F-type H+-transporting ATPase subunit G n=1 Tax=Trichoderma harzianum TaxID=5544 RepID=A0A2K0ULE1_TRIHA|nr:hypothetical protein THARTR1_01561 [Trichoderma harzianum]
MAPSSLARPMLRSPALRQLAFRRFESSAAGKATDAAKDAANKAKEYQAKAAQGLSRVAGAAGPAIAGAARGLTNALGKVGGRTGKLISFAVYYGKVAVETSKIVFHAQKMSPPSVATFQNFYQSLWKSVQSGAILKSPQNLLQQARSLTPGQLVAGGVIFAECLGFFTVGEMIGRFKLIGYRGETASHH